MRGRWERRRGEGDGKEEEIVGEEEYNIKILWEIFFSVII